MVRALLNEKARALGLAWDEPRGRSLSADDFEVAESIGAAHVYAQEGRFEDALKGVNRGLASAPLHQDLNWRRLRLLHLLKKEKPWQQHLARFLRQQLSCGMEGSAVQIWLEALQQRPGFRFDDDPALCLSLARALHERGRLKDAQHVLMNLHQRAPDFRQLGDAYVLLAQLYLEHQADLVRAGKLLQFVSRRFPEQFNSQAGQQTQSMFKRLQASG